MHWVRQGANAAARAKKKVDRKDIPFSIASSLERAEFFSGQEKKKGGGGISPVERGSIENKPWTYSKKQREYLISIK